MIIHTWKTKDGRIFEWKVEEDDPLCTLQDVFQKVDGSVGFNIELKFDDQTIYKLEEFTHILQVILKVFLLCSFCYLANLSFTLSNGSYIYTELQFQVVLEHAKDRPVMFSSFQPDAAQLMRKLQNKYPVRSLVSFAMALLHSETLIFNIIIRI